MTYCYDILFSVRVKWTDRKLSLWSFIISASNTIYSSLVDDNSEQQNPEMKFLYNWNGYNCSFTSLSSLFVLGIIWEYFLEKGNFSNESLLTTRAINEPMLIGLAREILHLSFYKIGGKMRWHLLNIYL